VKTRLLSACQAALLVAPMVAIAGAAASPAAVAQTVTRNPQDVEGGTYAVEPMHTRVLFSVWHLQFTTYYGDFTHVSGTLTLSPKDPAGSKVEVKMPVDTVSTTNPKLDGELKSADWLDASKFPTMTYRSTRVTVTGPGAATLDGDLTLHGVTKPVPLAVHFNAAGVNPLDHHYTVGFEATGMIKRSDFGVVKYIPYIGDDVSITISAAFEKQG
jgi:polyisoprenoid-binding protein YceI